MEFEIGKSATEVSIKLTGTKLPVQEIRPGVKSTTICLNVDCDVGEARQELDRIFGDGKATWMN